MTDHDTSDVLVVGSGIAGLAAALGAVRELEQRESSERASSVEQSSTDRSSGQSPREDGETASREGSDVTVATKATRPEGASSWWAQGGIAVSRDHPEQFKQDIVAASDDTADPDAVDVLVENANDAVEDVLLETLDVEFDENGEGLDFTREAAHSEDRILHVDAATGKHIHVPFLNYLDAHDGVAILDDTAALELIRHEGRVHGAMLESDGEVTPHYAGSVVLATGGAGTPRTVIGRPDDPHPILAERELDAPSAGHAALASVARAGAHDRRDNPLTQAFFTGGSETEYGTAGERLLDRLLRHSIVPSGPDSRVDPGFTLVCLDPDHSRHSGDLRRVVDRFVDGQQTALTRTFQPAAIRDRAETALDEGIAVEESVWRDVFDRSSEVLAPEFEGSYRGAGFNINE